MDALPGTPSALRERDLDVTEEPPSRWLAVFAVNLVDDERQSTMATAGGQLGAVTRDRPRTLGEDEPTLLADLAACLENDLNVERELSEGGELQRRLLPTNPADVPGVEAAGRRVSARELDGSDRLAAEEFLLAVTDGILEAFPDTEIGLERAGALPASVRPDERVDRVIGLAADRDGSDNITAVVVRRRPLQEPM